jgi:hypothetical protein
LGVYPPIQSHGDTVSGGERDFAPSVTRYRNDGSGLVDRWAPGSGNASVRGAVQETWTDPAGDLKTFLYYGFAYGYGGSQGSLRFLSPFDYATGTLGTRQFVYAYTPNASAQFPSPLANPAPARLLASTFGALSGEPATSGATLYDTTITAHGNLSVSLTVDHMQVQPGQAVAFHLTVHYAGDASRTGVRVSAQMPWQSGIDLPVCPGTNCVMDTTRGDLDATFDIAPGGTVDITGQVRVLDQATHPSMYARVWGPMDLTEDDVVDNLAQVTPAQSLFADGFED